MIDVILFDLDGTLIDSNDAHAVSWRYALKAEGFDFSYDQIRKLIGMGGDHLLPKLNIDHHSSTAKKIQKRRAHIYKTLWDAIRPFPKAKELIEMLELEHYQIGIASSAERSEVKKALKLLGIKKLISFVTTASDVKRSKPSADVIVACLQKASVRPERCLFVGDTPYDIKAASKVGVRTIAFESGGWTKKELVGAVNVFKSPEHFLTSLQTNGDLVLNPTVHPLVHLEVETSEKYEEPIPSVL